MKLLKYNVASVTEREDGSQDVKAIVSCKRKVQERDFEAAYAEVLACSYGEITVEDVTDVEEEPTQDERIENLEYALDLLLSGVTE